MEATEMSLQERLRERKKATKWERGLDLDYATEWEPDQLCVEAAAELDRLQARVAELEVDAERYRWIESQSEREWESFYLPRVRFVPRKAENKQTLGECIDTARKAKP